MGTDAGPYVNWVVGGRGLTGKTCSGSPELEHAEAQQHQICRLGCATRPFPDLRVRERRQVLMKCMGNTGEVVGAGGEMAFHERGENWLRR